MGARGLEALFDDVPQVSVTQYTAAIKKALEGSIPPAWVLGEVSNLRRQSSGHLYFSLKDAGAQVPAVMFRGQASHLGFEPRDGMQVLAFGEISVYEPHGRYQLMVREMKESGEGRLFREFERLKRKLSEEGLFAGERKRPIPLLPLRVAIVTSPSGAALQDFMRILRRRAWGGLLHVFPAKVQGTGAAEEIVDAIEYVETLGGYDLLVLARGGGSIEDLWAFNEEKVARAVFGCSIPVISGVGHEIDFTLSDFVADVRAETPSAAAEMISSSYLDAMNRFSVARERLQELALGGLERCRIAKDRLVRDLRAVSPVGTLERSLLRIDDLGTRLGAAYRGRLYEGRKDLRAWEDRYASLEVSGRVGRVRERLERLERRLDRSFIEGVSSLRTRLDLSGATLQAISPVAILQRGYAILQTPEGESLMQVGQSKVGDSVRAVLCDGSMELSIDTIERNPLADSD